MNKEKYIYERKTNKGSKYFQIQIAFKDEYNQPKTFYKNIQINEYPSRSIALKRAIAERDKALYEIQSNKLITSSLTIEQLIQKKSELLPCSKSTQQKHSILYKSISFGNIVFTASMCSSKIFNKSSIFTHLHIPTKSDSFSIERVFTSSFPLLFLTVYRIANFSAILYVKSSDSNVLIYLFTSLISTMLFFDFLNHHDFI